MLSRRSARTGMLVLVAALLAGGAAFVVSGSGAQQPLGPQLISVTGPVLTVADPVGGPAWRIESSRHGHLVCVQARRLIKARPDNPRANPAIGGCVDTRSRSRRQVVASRSVGEGAPRTLVMGFARPSVRRVTITGPGGAQSFDLSARGRAFLAVFAGAIESRHFGAGVTREDGTHESFGLGSPSATYAADPDHGTPWIADSHRFTKGPRAGQTCVTVTREQPRFGPRGPGGGGRQLLCADLSGPAFFFRVIHRQGRTMVVGAAGPTVTGVGVRAKGETRRAPLAARGRAFLAVFDGAKVHSYDLTVVIHKRHGTNMFSGQRSMNLGFSFTVRSDPLPHASQGRCPAMPFERVGPGDIAGLRRAVIDQVPQIYRGTNLKQMRIVRFVHAPRDRDRGGYARVKCGPKAWRRNYVAYLDFPAMRPSASLSQGVVLVGRFGGKYRIWARLH